MTHVHSHAHTTLVEQARRASDKLVKSLESGDRKYEEQMTLLREYQSHQKAADVIAGYVTGVEHLTLPEIETAVHDYLFEKRSSALTAVEITSAVKVYLEKKLGN